MGRLWLRLKLPGRDISQHRRLYLVALVVECTVGIWWVRVGGPAQPGIATQSTSSDLHRGLCQGHRNSRENL